MKNTKKIFLVAALVALAAGTASAQLTAAFGGARNAFDYAYGWPGIAYPALQVATGNTITGAGTITLVTGMSTNSSGNVFAPLSVNTPITVGIGADSETVTPTAISGCNVPQVYTCQVTATFSNLHGPQEPVVSGSYGLQEAINAANADSGGIVVVTGAWKRLGGTNATILAASGGANIEIQDNRGAGADWWSYQPTTLTVLAAPTTLTSTNIVFAASPTGTWAASSTHFLATCVDALGGESAGSADYTQTPTVNYTLTVPVPPTCSTGAVGYRVYAGTASAAVAYLLPITSTNCVLTTLETVIPACALTSAGTWSPTFATTTTQVPLALGVTNQNNPVPQGHTTFGYQPAGISPAPSFQSHYGPFGSGTIASATQADVTVLGTVNLPTGYLNQIGRTVRISGKIVGGATASGTLAVLVGLGWAGGLTAGAPIPVCNIVSSSLLGTQNYTVPFVCTWTTNAVGTTAVGTLQTDSYFIAGGTAGTTNIVASDANLSAVGSLGLFAQDSVYVYITPGASAITAARLMDLSIETLQ